MMPPTMLTPREDMLYSPQTSPELRRMDMFNRARREERETQLFSVNPRHSMHAVSTRRNASESLSISRLFQMVRNGLGSMLITAGNRIQNPA